jgi:hypothetical protein
MSDKDLVQVRKRFYDDFVFWAKHACRIRTKEGTTVPLVLNRVQRRFVRVVVDQLRATGKIRVVVLKARQQGLSTVIHAMLYWWLSQHSAQKGVVVTHKADSTRALFDMYHRTHENVPAMLKPSTKYKSRNQLHFDKLDTGLIVATAGGDSIARGETITHAHLSELAFWPKSSAQENFNGLTQSIPDAAGSAIFIESTANGFNDFHTMWTGACDGTNGYIPFFSPWFESDEYRTAVPEGFERTIEEQELVERFGVDDGQLAWRRQKIAQNGRELFMQEYPATPEEAFIASGRPVFDPELVVPLLRDAPLPLSRMAVEGGKLAPHSRGELLVYKEHDTAQTYTIGADVAMGVRGGDYSVAQVLDGDKQQVATWRGHIHPDEFASVLKALGDYYNNALVAVETEKHGLLAAVILWRTLNYANIYFTVREGQIDEKDTTNIGFKTTVETKPMVIDRLRAAVRDGDIKLYDTETLREMQTFIVTESGKMEAEEGCHDDCVMALAIAHHCHVRGWKPIAVTDEYYVAAI